MSEMIPEHLQEILDVIQAPLAIPPHLITAAYELGFSRALKGCGGRYEESTEDRQNAIFEMLEDDRLKTLGEALR